MVRIVVGAEMSDTVIDPRDNHAGCGSFLRRCKMLINLTCPLAGIAEAVNLSNDGTAGESVTDGLIQNSICDPGIANDKYPRGRVVIDRDWGDPRIIRVAMIDGNRNDGKQDCGDNCRNCGLGSHLVSLTTASAGYGYGSGPRTVSLLPVSRRQQVA